MQSAKRHNLALSPYLNDVLRRLPYLIDAAASLECLLPDRWAEERPDHVLAERQEESRQANVIEIRIACVVAVIATQIVRWPDFL